MMAWVYDDGGRAKAGFKGSAGDCGARALAIAADIPYQEAYDLINGASQRERPRRGRTRSSARTGVHGRTLRRVLQGIGWAWTPTMKIGSGCKVHLRRDELPAGRLLAFVSKHFVAVVDGVVHDTHDPTRDGTRCVYGYWQRPEVAA